MSQAYSQPVLRRNPPLIQPQLRNVNAYLANEKSAQLNTTMIASAAGSWGLATNALAKGVTDIGNTLTSIEAKQQYTDAMFKFRNSSNRALTNIKSQPLYKNIETEEGETTKVPAYLTSLKAFETYLKNERNRISKTITNRATRNQFLSNTIAEYESTYNSAVTLNHKQQVEFQTITMLDQIGNEWQLYKLEALKTDETAIFILGAEALYEAIEKRKTELATQHYAGRIINATMGDSSVEKTKKLKQIEEELNSEGGGYLIRGYHDDEGKWVEGSSYGNPEMFEILTSNQKIALHNSIAKHRKDIEDKLVKEQGKTASDTAASIFLNTDEWEKTRLAEMAQKGLITGSQLTSLLSNLRTAKNGVIQSNPEKIKLLQANIGGYTIDQIYDMADLTNADKTLYADRRRAWGINVNRWDNPSNPEGSEAADAKDYLKLFFKVDRPDTDKWSNSKVSVAADKEYLKILRYVDKQMLDWKPTEGGPTKVRAAYDLINDIIDNKYLGDFEDWVAGKNSKDVNDQPNPYVAQDSSADTTPNVDAEIFIQVQQLTETLTLDQKEQVAQWKKDTGLTLEQILTGENITTENRILHINTLRDIGLLIPQQELESEELNTFEKAAEFFKTIIPNWGGGPDDDELDMPDQIDTRELDLEMWQSIPKDSNDPDLYQQYLDEFPDGVYSGIASLKLKDLEKEENKDVQVESIPDPEPVESQADANPVPIPDPEPESIPDPAPAPDTTSEDRQSLINNIVEITDVSAWDDPALIDQGLITLPMVKLIELLQESKYSDEEVLAALLDMRALGSDDDPGQSSYDAVIKLFLEGRYK